MKGEKIDIVEYSEDPVVYVSNALSPSKVIDVLVDEEENATTVIVPDYQLSLAIGKRGQNARLAAKLTGWKIDIKSESEAREEGLLNDNNETVQAEGILNDDEPDYEADLLVQEDEMESADDTLPLEENESEENESDEREKNDENDDDLFV